MLADLVTGTAEKHNQSAAMVDSNRELTVFSFRELELLLDLAALRRYDQSWVVLPSMSAFA
jgi:hypothetical protein